MGANGNERFADVDNGVYYNGIANIQITDSTCIFHQVDYQEFSGILGSTSRSNVKITQAGRFIITFEEDEWAYTSGGSLIDGKTDLPVQGTYLNGNSGWIKIYGKTYTKSKSAVENEEDNNDE